MCVIPSLKLYGEIVTFFNQNYRQILSLIKLFVQIQFNLLHCIPLSAEGLRKNSPDRITFHAHLTT